MPVSLASPLPGYPGPSRFGWWPGGYRDGKPVKPEDAEADIAEARRLGVIT